MSWTAHIPETPVKKIHEAIDACATDPAELEGHHQPQLAAARQAAHALADAKVVAGEKYEITLGGHADPDGSTQADYVHVQVTQMPPKETAPSGFDAAKKTFHTGEEPAGEGE
jgi:hypothetical protein